MEESVAKPSVPFWTSTHMPTGVLEAQVTVPPAALAGAAVSVMLAATRANAPMATAARDFKRFNI